jgi:predicted dienelactone hydrolase
MPHLRLAPLVLLGALCVCVCAQHARAADAGWREITIPATGADTRPTSVALYYPSSSPAKVVPVGVFTLHVALDGTPMPTVKGLIVISHGTGGSELGHTTLAEALAQAGYLVAALRHPGDNWQDRSLLQTSAERYFRERPQQVTRVIDALLADPQWRSRIASDAGGPRIGAVGHSAGGYTVIALAGGEPDLARLSRHCSTERAEDPLFCATGHFKSDPPGAEPVAAVPLVDPRVRAVVALAPVGVVFSEASLARIHIPVAVYEAQSDRWLVPRFHAEWVARNVPGAALHRVPNAWHFAFLNAPGIPIGSPDGDLAADPAGFDRAGFLDQLAHELPAYFDRVWP